MTKNQMILFIITTFFQISFGTNSSSIPFKGSTKSVPIVINRVDISLMSKNDFVVDKNAEAKFVASGKYAKDDFLKIMNLAKEQNFPDGINTAQKLLERETDFAKYKSFYQGSWLQVNEEFKVAETYYLFWIPREDNLSMPQDMIPKTEDGFYIVVNTTAFDNTLLPLSKAPGDIFIKKMNTVFQKKNSIKLIDPYNRLAPNYGYAMEFAYESMTKTGGYNAEQFSRIKELATEKYWPALFTTDNRQLSIEQLFNAMKDYNCYLITTFEDESVIRELIWIPFEDNLHMPLNMQPVTKEGFYVVYRKENIVESQERRFAIRGYSPSGRLGYSIAGKNPEKDSVNSGYTYIPTNNQNQNQTITPSTSNATSNTQTYTSGNVSTSSYALDLFSELGSMAIYVGTKMYVVTVKGKSLGDKGSAAARAAQIAGVQSAYKYEWFQGKNCTTLKSQFGGTFTIICNGTLDLN